MPIKFILNILLIAFILGIAFLLGCIVKIEEKKPLSELVQEFLGDVQAYEENLRVQQAQFPILYDKSYTILSYLLMKEHDDETIEWAHHMYLLGWLNESMVYTFFSQYGNIFEEEEEQESSEPIRQYAMEVLHNLIESKDVFDENEKAHITKLLAEIRALEWFDFSSEEYLYLFERLCELGIEIDNC